MKKILVVNESSFLNSGYSVYGRNICKYLHNTGKYEVAELGVYGNDSHKNLVPWKFYPNEVYSQEQRSLFDSNPAFRFGAWKFHEVCNDFKPTHVCFKPDALVMTSNGYIPISDIKIGDKVLTHKNRFMPVNKLYRNEYKGDMISISINGMSNRLTLTPDHPVLIYRKVKQTNKRKGAVAIYENLTPEFIPAKDIRNGDKVVLPSWSGQYNSIDVTKYLKNYISVSDNQITNIDKKYIINRYILVDYDFSKLCGYLIGDGHLLGQENHTRGLSIFFSLDEKEFAEDAARIIKEKFGVDCTVNISDKENMWVCTIYSSMVSQILSNLIGHRYWNKKIPEEIICGSEAARMGLLQGLIRSDGWTTKKNVSFCCYSKSLAYTYRAVCNSLGICTLINNKPKYTIHAYGYDGILLDNIAKKYEKFTRKEDIVRDTSRVKFLTSNKHSISSVNRIVKSQYEGLVYNIGVEQDESYVVETCVHNCTWRDYWMDSFIDVSPYRPYFNWIWMPACDGYPQNEEWIDSFCRADAVLSYSGWGAKVLKQQGGDKINVVGHAHPCANNAFKPLANKREIKAKYGVENYNIIGTVMRNQRRKLYPDLFKAFADFIHKTGDKYTYLLCHTSYPDNGWDFPKFLMEQSISNRVLFTYICNNQSCKNITISLFNGMVQQCSHCKQLSAISPSVHNGLSDEQLSEIYNIMDLYVQWANCLAKDEEILTDKGWVKIQDVKVGDYAWTHKNRWKEVTATWINLEKSKYSKMLNLKFCSDYSVINATEDHECMAYTSKELTNKNSVREQLGYLISNNKKLPDMGRYRMDELSPGDMLCYPIDDTINDICSIDLSEYNTNMVINTDDSFCKWLGLYVADGSANLNKHCGAIRITSHLNEHLNHDLCENVMCKLSKGGVKTHFYKNRKALNKEIYNKPFVRYMKDHCRKLENKKFPEWVMKLPITKQKQCLIGLFMGDGHTQTRRGITTSILSVISKVLADQIKEICRRLRINFNVRIVTKKGNRKPQYRFEICGDIANGEFITDTHNTSNFYHGNHHYLKIKSINEVLYNDDVYCITVDEDHTMTTRAGSVYQCEGFGMPSVEAAACGIPLALVNYSAMSYVGETLEGFLIDPISYYNELETGCYRAVPNNNSLTNLFEDWFNTPEPLRLQRGLKTRRLYEQNFSWEQTAKKWEEIIDKLDPKDWSIPPTIYGTPPFEHFKDILLEADFITALFETMLPMYVNTHFHLNMINNLNNKMLKHNPCGYFVSDSTHLSNAFTKFERIDAYNIVRKKCEENNFLERIRINDIPSS